MNYPNPEQAAVLSHLDGTLLVLAPAGTGKTRLMADRLAAVIARGMPPEKTLGVTFTNRAAEHMRSAVRESCGADAKDCRIQTFHGLCAHVLQSGYAAKSGCGVSPQVVLGASRHQSSSPQVDDFPTQPS